MLVMIKIFVMDKGRQQADATGKRLQELGFPYSMIVRSTMTRAQQTAKIIEGSLKNIAVEDDSFLTEGVPIPPEPPIGHWKSEIHVILIYLSTIENTFQPQFYIFQQ